MNLERALSKTGEGTEERRSQQQPPLQERGDATANERAGSCAGEATWRVVNIVSCFLLATTVFFTFIFPNVTPYLTSYLRNATHSDVEYTDTLWLEQTATICRCTTMPFLGMLSARAPTRLYLFAGIVLSAAYLVGMYWAVQTSLGASLITFGIIGGLSRAVLYPTVIKVGAQWATRGNEGFVTGVVMMGFGIGPLVWNPLTTWYINPDNLEPQLEVGGDKYYTQSAVLDKVPTMFLVLGGVFTAIQLLCLLVIRQPQSTKTELTVSFSSSCKTSAVSEETQPLLKQTSGKTEPTSQDSEPPMKDTLRKQEEGSSPRPRKGGTGNARGHANVEYSWDQVLKSRVFWTLWFMFIFQGFGLTFVVPLFKAYGQTFIEDDHFLAIVATLGSAFNSVSRPVSGLLGDRVGPRLVLLVTQAFFAILVVTFSSCERTGEAAFLLWVCAMLFCLSSYYTMVAVLVVRLFGTDNFNTNFGLVDSSGIVGAFLPTLLAPYVKSAFGWNGLFVVAFGALCAGTFLNLSLEWCRFGDSIPRDMLPKLSIRGRRS